MRSEAPVILLLGSTGQLGRQIIRSCDSRVDLVLRTAARSDADPARRFDLERPDSVAHLIRRDRPDHIILGAAGTNVAWCETRHDASWVINVRAPQAAAEAARKLGATVTFISTDYVFDGSSGPYDELASTNPINVYGSHKLAAEEAVLAADRRNLVVRSCQVFGDDPRRMNYVLRLADQLRRGETVAAATDLFGTPTYAPDLATAIVRLTLDGESGIWHLAGDRFLSRYELARRVAAMFGSPSGVIAQVTADDLDDVVKRPRRAGLINGRLMAAGLDWITPLDRALATLAAEDYAR